MLTDRDAALLALIYKAAADGQDEIVLTEPDIDALTTGDHREVVVPQRIELGFEIHASTVQGLDRGNFELWVTAAPRAHTSMAGRFAYLLDQDKRGALVATFAPDEPDTIAVQLSFPPRRIRNDNVTRVRGLLPMSWRSPSTPARTQRR